MTWIGIDPGTHTGFAVWRDGAFSEICSLPLHDALLRVRGLSNYGAQICVVFEDARLRKWYGTHTAKQDRDRLIGAGSVRRDCSIWEEALTQWRIPYKVVAPKNNATKMNADTFRSLTGWEGRTNEHGRDAAMLVFGR